jgi:hypothetical protein
MLNLKETVSPGHAKHFTLRLAERLEQLGRAATIEKGSPQNSV